MAEESDKGGMGQFHHDPHNQMIISQAPNASSLVDVKQESQGGNSYVYAGHNGNEELHSSAAKSCNWSPKSCVTTSFSSNMLDFSNNNNNNNMDLKHPPPDRSSEVRNKRE